jgi:hypothetical protein
MGGWRGSQSPSERVIRTETIAQGIAEGRTSVQIRMSDETPRPAPAQGGDGRGIRLADGGRELAGDDHRRLSVGCNMLRDAALKRS